MFAPAGNWSHITLAVAFSPCRTLRLDWYFVSVDLTTSRTRSSAYTGYKCPKGSCSRSQCRLTGHCTVMPLSTFGSLKRLKPVANIPTRQRLRSSTSNDLCVPAVRLPTVGRRAFSVAGARNLLPADVTSIPSLFTFRKPLKLHIFHFPVLALSSKLFFLLAWSLW